MYVGVVPKARPTLYSFKYSIEISCPLIPVSYFDKKWTIIE